jgi:3-deoxy-D-manno-octulosonic-acid transferase
MRFLYTLGIIVYGLVIRIASVFNEKARLFIVGRKGVFQTIPDLNKKEVIWFHCASLGEFDQGLPLMFEIKNKQPHVFLLVTFFSPSGKEHYHKRNHPADFVCYLPLDTPSNAKKFISKINPKKVFFVKYEFWANYIKVCRRQAIPVYSVSTLLRPSHRFFKWYGGFFRNVLHDISYFYVQNEESGRLLESIGITKYLVVGDARFDRVIQNKENARSDEILEQFCPHKNAFIIGSSWDEDEEVLESLIKELIPDKKVIIAPHNIDEKHLQRIENRFSNQLDRYTKSKGLTGKPILLIDCIGKLSNAYQYGDIAYIGGGFSGSLHNILEPAVFGLPVIFGPKHKRFPEAQQFISEGIGFSIKNSHELIEVFNVASKQRDEIKTKAQLFIEKSIGSSLKVYTDCF